MSDKCPTCGEVKVTEVEIEESARNDAEHENYMAMAYSADLAVAASRQQAARECAGIVEKLRNDHFEADSIDIALSDARDAILRKFGIEENK